MNKNDVNLMSPQYWPAWLILSILWLISRLPMRWQINIGETLGRFLYLFPTKLKKITLKNLELCFPEYSIEKRKRLAKDNFAALGAGAMEAAMAWWLPDSRLSKLLNVHGFEHAEAALAKGKGVILIGPHFTCLEMIGRLMGFYCSFAVMYRPHKKRFVAYLHERFRSKNSVQYIPRHRMRGLLRALNENKIVWYAYDVDGGKKRSVFAPFFGIPTASLTAISRIIKLSDATVMPISFYRRDKEMSYDVFIAPPLENFPSDLVEDATRLNVIIEQAIREKPEQYVWQYKRFKTRPEGEKRFY